MHSLFAVRWTLQEPTPEVRLETPSGDASTLVRVGRLAATPMKAPFWAAEHWCQDETGKVRHSFEAVALLFALLMLPAVLIQDSGLHSPWGWVADGLNAVVWIAFALELALTLHHANDRRAALRAHWHDVLVFVVIFPAWAPLFSALGPGWLRGWRLARLWVIAGRIFRAERLLTRRRNLP